MKASSLRSLILAAVLATRLVAAPAQSTVSDASLLSTLPAAVSVAGPALVLSAGATLAIVSVEVSAASTVWVLERASDGARCSLRLSARAAGTVSVLAGTALLVTATSAGWVLSVASEAIAFVPNEIGAALLYNERVTR